MNLCITFEQICRVYIFTLQLFNELRLQIQMQRAEAKVFPKVRSEHTLNQRLLTD